jgi:hypothetical protein
LLTKWKSICLREGLVLPEKVIVEFDKRLKKADKGVTKAKLDLSNCNLDDDLLITLIESLSTNHILSKLDLRNNKVSDKGLGVLIRLLTIQIRVIQTTEAEDSINSTLLGEVLLGGLGLSGSETILNEIQEMTDILRHGNAQAHILQTYWNLKAPEEFDKEFLSIFWKAILGNVDIKSITNLLDSNTNLNYGLVEEELLKCLSDKGSLVNLNNSHGEKINNILSSFSSNNGANSPKKSMKLETSSNSSLGSPDDNCINNDEIEKITFSLVDHLNTSSSSNKIPFKSPTPNKSLTISDDNESVSAALLPSSPSSQKSTKRMSIISKTSPFSDINSSNNNLSPSLLKTFGAIHEEDESVRSNKSKNNLPENRSNTPELLRTHSPLSLRSRRSTMSDISFSDTKREFGGGGTKLSSMRSQMTLESSPSIKAHLASPSRVSITEIIFNDEITKIPTRRLSVTPSSSPIMNVSQQPSLNSITNIDSDSAKILEFQSEIEKIDIPLSPEEIKTNENKKFIEDSVSSGSLDFSNSGIEKLFIPDLLEMKYFTNIQILSLQTNKLTNLEELSLHVLSSLIELDLSHNNFSGIILEGCFPVSLITLDISHNKITDITGLVSCTDINVLDVSNNLIDDIQALPIRIEQLNLSDNRIFDPFSLRILCLCGQKIIQLGIAGNSVLDIKGYDVRTILNSNLPCLVELDGVMRPNYRVRKTNGNCYSSTSTTILPSVEPMEELNLSASYSSGSFYHNSNKKVKITKKEQTQQDLKKYNYYKLKNEQMKKSREKFDEERKSKTYGNFCQLSSNEIDNLSNRMSIPKQVMRPKIVKDIVMSTPIHSEKLLNRAPKNNPRLDKALQVLNEWLITSIHDIGRAVAVFKLVVRMTASDSVLDENEIEKFFQAVSRIPFVRGDILSPQLSSLLSSLSQIEEQATLFSAAQDTLEQMNAFSCILQDIERSMLSEFINTYQLTATLNAVMKTKAGNYVNDNILKSFGCYYTVQDIIEEEEEAYDNNNYNKNNDNNYNNYINNDDDNYNNNNDDIIKSNNNSVDMNDNNLVEVENNTSYEYDEEFVTKSSDLNDYVYKNNNEIQISAATSPVIMPTKASFIEEETKTADSSNNKIGETTRSRLEARLIKLKQDKK